MGIRKNHYIGDYKDFTQLMVLACWFGVFGGLDSRWIPDPRIQDWDSDGENPDSNPPKPPNTSKQQAKPLADYRG